MNRLRDIFEQNNFEVLVYGFVNSSNPLQNDFFCEHLRIFKPNQTIQMVEKSKVSHIFANRQLSVVHMNCGWEVVSLKPLAYYQKILRKGLDFLGSTTMLW
jgi:hypothetical protein